MPPKASPRKPDAAFGERLFRRSRRPAAPTISANKQPYSSAARRSALFTFSPLAENRAPPCAQTPTFLRTKIRGCAHNRGRYYTPLKYKYLEKQDVKPASNSSFFTFWSIFRQTAPPVLPPADGVSSHRQTGHPRSGTRMPSRHARKKSGTRHPVSRPAGNIRQRSPPCPPRASGSPVRPRPLNACGQADARCPPARFR